MDRAFHVRLPVELVLSRAGSLDIVLLERFVRLRYLMRLELDDSGLLQVEFQVPPQELEFEVEIYGRDQERGRVTTILVALTSASVEIESNGGTGLHPKKLLLELTDLAPTQNPDLMAGFTARANAVLEIARS